MLLLALHRWRADYVFPEKTPELRALSERAKKLKGILARVPAEIVDRPKFLALIREVAVAIKVRALATTTTVP